MADIEKREGMGEVELSNSNAQTVPQSKIINEEARQATATEHSLSFWQAIKTYKKAAFWSICKSRHAQMYNTWPLESRVVLE